MSIKIVHRSVPIALTIAGSDSGGGAGIGADIRTFTAFGVHGVSVITAVTAQNPFEVRKICPIPADIIHEQLYAIWDCLRPSAIKIGMIWGRASIKAISEFLKARRERIPIVIDPVMVASSGAALIEEGGREILISELIPLSTVLTPNLDEVRSLIGWRPEEPEQMRKAAKEIYRLFGCAVVIKGGHLKDLTQMVDIFYNGKQEWLLKSPRINVKMTHGTGCAFSAAIAAGLARGLKLPDAIFKAKEWINKVIAGTVQCGKTEALGLFGAIRI